MIRSELSGTEEMTLWEELAFREKHVIVRERHFSSSKLMQVVQYLRSQKATGQMILDWSHGGIAGIRFREEQDIRYDPQDTSR